MASLEHVVPGSTAVLLTVAGIVLYQLGKVLYRLFYHPLKDFPGPRLAAATFWYEIYFDVFKAPGGQFIYELDRLHDIYGPVVRCNPEEIHVRDSSWYDTLYSGPGHVRDKWERSNRANGAPGSVASTVNHDLHRARKAAVFPLFSKRTINELEDSIRKYTEKACVTLRECAEDGRVVHLGTAFTALTLDVITEYCYDKCQKCLDEPDFAPRWKQLMQGLFESVPVSKHFPIVAKTMQSLPRPIVKFLDPGFATFFEAQDSIMGKAREVWLSEKKGKLSEMDPDEKPKTVFHGILKSSLPEQEKSMERMADEAFVLIVAGGETTAQVITVTLSYLLRDLPLFTRLRKELDKLDVVSEIPMSRQLEEIPLMKAVVQEGLRIAAPVTSRPMLIAPNEDLKCGEWIIPRGTPCSLSHRNVLYDPEIFPEPHTFDPDRWILAAQKGERLDRFLVTFGKGTRSCLGTNLAYAELIIAVATMVSRFDMELVDFDQQRDIEIVRDRFVGMPSKESRGVRVKLEIRR